MQQRMRSEDDIEDPASWRLFNERAKSLTGDRRLNEARQFQRRPKQQENESDDDDTTDFPKVHGGTVHGMMIDAGSQGTRIHVYEYEARVLRGRREIENAVNGKKLSFPTTNARWTNRLKPGLDVFASIQDENALKNALMGYLRPLLDFAKVVLSEKRHRWADFPIYLKATGGMRTLPTPDRVRVMKAVRDLFFDVSFNPFAFEEERARVISGEEEAIYGWAAVNFVKGTLLSDSEGTGTVLNPRRTYGMIEMGGASTQIGYYESNDDVMADLFKLQIGGARHWNVYCHSYLFFGINGGFDRLVARLYAQAEHGTTSLYNPCLPGHTRVNHSSWIHFNSTDSTLLPRSDPGSTLYTVSLINDNDSGDFDSCNALVYLLLRKEANRNWVMFSHDYDCSFAGVYQPPLPINTSGFGEFIATSNYADIWQFLRLPVRSEVGSVQEAARKICKMNLAELVVYNQGLESPVREGELSEYCFRSLFVFNMLHNGHGFPLDYKINAVDVLNGQKLGWALGSILYEINTLPWSFAGKVKVTNTKSRSNLWGFSGNSEAEVTMASRSIALGVLGIALISVFAAVVFGRRMRDNNHGYHRIS